MGIDRIFWSIERRYEMSIPLNIKKHLERNHIDYEVLPHKEEFTAQKLAECLHVSGKVMAKVVMLKADNQEVMTVLPACRRLNMGKLKAIFNTEDIRLECENEFRDKFPECEIGAMPPFGNLYDIDVYVDSTLADDDYILMQVGNHREALRLKYTDFVNLVHPTVEEFTVKAA